MSLDFLPQIFQKKEIIVISRKKKTLKNQSWKINTIERNNILDNKDQVSLQHTTLMLKKVCV